MFVSKLDQRGGRELSMTAHPHTAVSELVEVAHHKEEVRCLLHWEEAATRDVDAWTVAKEVKIDEKSVKSCEFVKFHSKGNESLEQFK